MPGSKTILITGAGSGVGRGLCQHFAARGLQVIASDANPEAAEETARIGHDSGHSVRALTLDVTRQPDIEVAIGNLPDRRVDILINNAGLQHVAKLEEFPPEKWNLLIDIMLNGPAWMTRAVLPGMKARNFGRIVNIGSIHSLIGSPFKSAYVAAKHGLLGLSKVVALETAEWNITINTICPSYIRTPLVDSQIKNQAQAHKISEAEVIEKIMLKPMPKKKFIGIEEVAATTEFLCSDAARNITGQSIAIDGGWTAQ